MEYSLSQETIITDPAMETFQIRNFADLIRALRSHPDWLEELRRLILTEQLLELPKKLDELANRFERFVEEEFRPLKQKVEGIEVQVGVLKTDVEGLKIDVEQLKIDVAQLKVDVAQLKIDVAQLKIDVAQLKVDVAQLKIDVAELKGDNFERKIRERAPAYLGGIIKRCRVISVEELANSLDDALDNGLISDSEKNDALLVDMVAKGILKEQKLEVIVVAEISIKGDRTDVERSFRRGEIISKALNIKYIPVVIGKEFTEGAKALAEKTGVLLL